MTVTVCDVEKKEPTTSLKAIRMKCLDCCEGSKKEVELCPVDDCPLYFYRFGHNPKRKGLGNISNLPVSETKRYSCGSFET